MSQEIISEIKNHTGIITLKTEDGLNAVNRRMLAEIAEAATTMDMNDEVKAIIIRGGEKPFRRRRRQRIRGRRQSLGAGRNVREL